MYTFTSHVLHLYQEAGQTGPGELEIAKLRATQAESRLNTVCQVGCVLGLAIVLGYPCLLAVLFGT